MRERRKALVVMPGKVGAFAAAFALAVLAAVSEGAGSPAAPVGFASLDGGTSGGDAGNTCAVEAADETALRTAIACTRKSTRGGVVVFRTTSKEIRLARRIDLPSNITIRGPATLSSGAADIFRISGSRNVIISDLVLVTKPGAISKRGRTCPDPTSPRAVAVGDNETPGTTGCTVPIMIQGTNQRKNRAPPEVSDASNIWIDHNTFVRCGDKCITIKNGQRKPDGRFSGADRITISNNRFSDSFFAVLITVVNREKGGARELVFNDTAKCDTRAGLLPRMRVTVQGNLFEHVRRRMVRAAYCTSYVHEFNNAIIGFGLPVAGMPRGTSCRDQGFFGFGPSVRAGGRMLLENNYIAAWPNDPNGCKAAVETSAESGMGNEGYLKDTGNIYANGAFGGSNKLELVAKPPYSYQLLPAAAVLDSVRRNAGARK